MANPKSPKKTTSSTGMMRRLESHLSKLGTEIRATNTRLSNIENNMVVKRDIQGVESKITNVETRIAKVETSISNMDERIGNMDTRIGNMDIRIEKMETGIRKMDTRIEKVEAGITKVDNKIIKVETRISNVEVRITKMDRSLKKRMGKHRNEILKAISDLAITTPTEKEFEELKARVDRYHPVS